MPLYAGGYGVGEILPSAYSYYNVPMQYRGLYYPTADYSYWYAPGAIYQYDQRTSLITSVAALMSPGFTVGRPLPMGYGMDNVPLAYRGTDDDTSNTWYRYNDGYIYQVNPATMMVTGIAASLLKAIKRPKGPSSADGWPGNWNSFPAGSFRRHNKEGVQAHERSCTRAHGWNCSNSAH